jgi:phosphoserine phosphatase
LLPASQHHGGVRAVSIPVTGPKLIVFDCDSTLSSIEGIDELARVRGPETFAAVEAMTHDAMDGRLSVEAVFARRLEIIEPRRADVDAVGQLYIDTIEPTARTTITALRARGWTPIILSGGFRPAIRPLADHLSIDRVEAVDLYFDEQGCYTGFDASYPTTRSGGKPEVIRRLKAEFGSTHVVMVGDGVSDLETTSEVNQFIGFGGYVVREKVKAGARQFVTKLSELIGLVD